MYDREQPHAPVMRIDAILVVCAHPRLTPSVVLKRMLKKRCLRLLKHKRTYENQREALLNQAFNLDQQNAAVSSIKDTKATVAAMKATNKALVTGMKDFDVDEVADIQDDMEDALMAANEVQVRHVLSASHGDSFAVHVLVRVARVVSFCS